MQYMLAIYGDERAGENVPREQMTEIINAYMAYGQALRDAKVLVASNRLRPTSAATTVRIADGKTQVLDGPFAGPRSNSAAPAIAAPRYDRYPIHKDREIGKLGG